MSTLTTKDKLEILKEFYCHCTRDNQATLCPFGKDPPPVIRQPKQKRNENCSELCGAFPMLGDVRRGCPCQIFGAELALYILGTLLKQKNLI